jgi:hypothetical protein
MWPTGIAAGHDPSVAELNLFELMARADRGQTNIFRDVAGFSNMQRDAVRRMGEGMTRTENLQLKLTSILAKPPAEQLAAMIHDKAVLEDHQHHRGLDGRLHQAHRRSSVRR